MAGKRLRQHVPVVYLFSVGIEGFRRLFDISVICFDFVSQEDPMNHRM
jgi:hypothetical protein